MVYETRRVYSGSRPVLSTTSYSYSPYEEFPAAAIRRPDLFLSYAPVFKKGRRQHRVIIPVSRMVNQRLTRVSAPPRSSHQNFYEALDYGRNGNHYVLVNYRPTPPPIPVTRSRVTYIEDVTNNSFDDIGRETRSMQRDMDTMLYRVSAGLPFSPSHYSSSYPTRSSSEVKEVADMRRLYVRDRDPSVAWGPMNKFPLYRNPIIHYPDPLAVSREPKYYFIGRQNLACLSFAGGRPIPKRRRFYPGYEDKVLDDVTFRSFYSKLRNAANLASNTAKATYVRATQYQPLHYSKKTLFGENAPKREVKESKWVQKAMANDKEPAKKNESLKRSSVKEARRESLTQERRPEIPPPGRPINVTLPGPRKSITEIMKEDLPKHVENLPEQSVTVRRPSKLDAVPSTPPIVEAVAAETFKLPKKAKEPTPPPKEPTPPPKEPTPPPKEPTPPPKEPTPPPKEPTPPPKEPTPPPKEPTPPPKEPTPEPEVVPEEIAVSPAEDEVLGGDEEEEKSEVAEASEAGSNKGEEVADIPLDEEPAEAEVKVELDNPAVNGPVETEPEIEAELIETTKATEVEAPEEEKEEASAEAEEAQPEEVQENDKPSAEEVPEGVRKSSVAVAETEGVPMTDKTEIEEKQLLEISAQVEVESEVAAGESQGINERRGSGGGRRGGGGGLEDEHLVSEEIVEKVELVEQQTESLNNSSKIENQAEQQLERKCSKTAEQIAENAEIINGTKLIANGHVPHQEI